MQILKDTTQSAHYYSKDGKPQHTVIGKSTGKPRPTTIADARKNDWLPSCTTILKVLHKPALERWKIGQAVLACMTATKNPDEDIDAFINRVLNIEGQDMQEAAIARDLGIDIHDALETVLNGGQCSPELSVYVGPALELIQRLQQEYGVKVMHTEKILIGDGYAGTTDLILGDNLNLEILVDFKTTKSIPKTEPWAEHKIQLAAYANTRKAPSRRIFNLYISTIELGKVSLLDCGDWKEIYPQFHHILQYWKLANKF